MNSPRFQPGTVRDAIISFLRRQSDPATLAEIREGAEALLQRPVPNSSVRSYLNLNVPSTFIRTSLGRYQLTDDTAPERQRLLFPKSRPRLAFQRPKSAVYQGDCCDWLAEWEENSIHAVVTDPPYGLVEYTPQQQNKLRSGRGGVWRIPPSFDGSRRAPVPRFTTLSPQDIRDLGRFFYAWARVLRRVLVPGAHVFVASNPLVSYAMAAALVEAGLERRGEIIRLVMTLRGGDRPKNAHEQFPDVSVMPRSQWEPWLLFREPIEGRVQDNLRRWKTGALRRPSSDKPFCDVIQSRPTHHCERRLAPHPSLKPQAFLRQIVHAALPLCEGIVLDPFAGAGSTLAACEHAGYESIGVEIDEHYVDMAEGAIPLLANFQPNSSSR